MATQKSNLKSGFVRYQGGPGNRANCLPTFLPSDHSMDECGVGCNPLAGE